MRGGSTGSFKMHDEGSLPATREDVDEDRSFESDAAASGSTLAARPSARSRSLRPRRKSGITDAPSASPTPTTERGSQSSQATAQGEAAIANVLIGDEITRAHGFSRLIGLVSLLVLLALPFLEGDPGAKTACAMALGLISLSSVGIWRLTRADSPHARNALRAYGFTLATCVLFVENYIGFFSPVAVIVTLGVYYFAQSADRMQALLVPALVSGSYLVVATLITFGLLPDRGLIDGSSAPLSSHVFAILAVTLVLVLTAHMAHVARASMRSAIERSNEALLVARSREVLLAEAQQHLERALGVAVGKAGHYSGQLAGDFTLDVIIGLGAMGEVYAAKNLATGEEAAVKLLRPTALRRDDLVERFLREGAICAELKNPHLVQVYGAGQLEDGAPYLAMELLRGHDLASHLRKEGSMPGEQVSTLARALADGLSHVHQNGVVHRDLKPVNVFHAEQPGGGTRWKILDFGISKPRASTGTLTDVGVVGTPGYMSPEQARGHSVDHRSDIFSMAVVMYRALTGRPAFSGNDTPQIMFEVVYHMPERPSSVVKQLPSDVDSVFAIALAKAPADRFGSVTELAAAFELALQRELDPQLRKRAQHILRSSPWGKPLVAVRGSTPELAAG